MDFDKDEVIWSEKYRPKTINDCILPEDIKRIFLSMVETKTIPNMILSGSAGVGKTTIAKALCEEINADYICINASNENGVDMVRNGLTKFTSKVSMTGGRKVVILDEADYLSANAQPALRGVIQDCSKICSIIMTCNFPNRIIDPLHSRCKKIDFTIKKDDKPKCMSNFYQRLLFILDNEKIEYDSSVLMKLVKKYYPDNRKIINEIQTYSTSGKVDEGILSVLESLEYNDLISSMKSKKYNGVRQWVADNVDNITNEIYWDLYSRLSTKVSPQSIPELVMVIAEWQKHHSNVSSTQLNVLGMLTELMGSVEFV